MLTPACDTLTQIAEQQRANLLKLNTYYVSGEYSASHPNATTAKGVGDAANAKGKGTGRYLDHNDGGSDIDKNGIPSLASGRILVYSENFYTKENKYDCQ